MKSVDSNLLFIWTDRPWLSGSRRPAMTLPVHKSIINTIADGRQNAQFENTVKQVFAEHNLETQNDQNALIFYPISEIERIFSSVSKIVDLNIEAILSRFNLIIIVEEYSESRWIPKECQFLLIDSFDRIENLSDDRAVYIIDSKEKYDYYKDNLNGISDIIRLSGLSKLEIIMTYDMLKKELPVHNEVVTIRNFENIIIYEVV